MAERDWAKDWLEVSALCMLENKLSDVKTKYGTLTFKVRCDRDDRVPYQGYWLDKATEVLQYINEEQLEAENRCLKAVVEAASEYVKNCADNECDDEGMYDLCETTCPLEDLREALAALEEANEGG